MKRSIFAALALILSWCNPLFGQITIEPTPTTQGLWGSAVNGRGESFVAGNNGTIFRKRGACALWEAVPVPVTNGLRSITFLQDSIGIAVGVSGTVFRSDNWGDSWSLIMSGTTAGLLGVTQLNDSILLATGGGSAGNVVIRSIDLGLTWTLATSTLSASGFGITTVNDSTVMLSGVGGMVMRSTDYGSSWSSVAGPFAGTLSDITFGSPQIGIIVGQGGVVYRTEDGGLNWSLVASSTSAFLNGAKAISPSKFIAVGNTGTVIESSDSGRTWSVLSTGNTTTLRAVNQNSNGFFAAGNSGLIFLFAPTLGYSVIFREDFCSFQDSTQVPVGWTNTSPNASGALWRFDNPRQSLNNLNNFLEPPFAIYDAGFHNLTSADSAILTTATFATTGHTQLTLRWHESFAPNAGGNTRIYIQYHDGTTWQTAYVYEGAREGSNRIQTTIGPGNVFHAKRAIDLSSAGNLATTQIRMIYTATGANRQWWAIDNLELVTAPRDLAINNMVFNDSACALPIVDQPEVVIQNNSLFSIFPIELAWQVDGGTPAFTTHLTGIGAGQQLQVPVSAAPINVSGNGQLKVWLVNTFESNRLNDTLLVTYGQGNLAIGFNGDTLQLCQGDSLRVGAALPGATYQWVGAGTGTSDSVWVTAGGWLILTASQNGCNATDSLFINQISLPTNPLLAVLPDTVLQGAFETLPAAGLGLQGRYQISRDGILLLDSITTASIGYTFDSVGIYVIRLEISDQGCVVVYEHTVVVIASNISIPEWSPAQVSWFPNPARESITVHTPKAGFTIRIVDLAGRVLLEAQSDQQQTQLWLNKLPNGSYLIQLLHSESGFVKTDKLLIQD
jgi:photosystem II stability/assembly factor-like uncharacterized protein